MHMIWAQRIFTILIIVVISYVIFYLVEYIGHDAVLVAILSFIFNVVIYFIGRADKIAEDNKTPD
jgi:hypothetical protein